MGIYYMTQGAQAQLCTNLEGREEATSVYL